MAQHDRQHPDRDGYYDDDGFIHQVAALNRSQRTFLLPGLWALSILGLYL